MNIAARHCAWPFFYFKPPQAAARSTPADPGFVKHAQGDLTRNSWATKSATACALHNGVSNRSASGPRCSECMKLRNSAPLSQGLRPAGLAFSERPGHNVPLARPSDTAAADSPRVGTIWRPANTAPSTHHNPGVRHESCPCHPIYLKL